MSGNWIKLNDVRVDLAKLAPTHIEQWFVGSALHRLYCVDQIIPVRAYQDGLAFYHDNDDMCDLCLITAYHAPMSTEEARARFVREYPEYEI